MINLRDLLRSDKPEDDAPETKGGIAESAQAESAQVSGAQEANAPIESVQEERAPADSAPEAGVPEESAQADSAPEKSTPEAGSSHAFRAYTDEGDKFVPDFTKDSDRIEAAGKADADRASTPDHGSDPNPNAGLNFNFNTNPTPNPAPTPEPVRAVASENALGQPAWRKEDDEPEIEEGEEVPVMGVSLISKEATILGDIITEGHIDVIGKVRGNVEAQGNIAIRGLVSGDLTGEKIGLYKCRVKGDLKAGTGVVIDSDSVIIGNVDTDNVVLGGKLKGDIKAVKMAVLRSDAYFIGDVLTESLAVESGAVVNGNIRTIVQGDIEAPFDD
ncbi:MAG: polymer-forming cytoskeletal protein [Clostridiales Family XIII bacterium]|nr:polymer-forming cytoskeletal protein [Clostridiales Family XIII bacterium]